MGSFLAFIPASDPPNPRTGVSDFVSSPSCGCACDKSLAIRHSTFSMVTPTISVACREWFDTRTMKEQMCRTAIQSAIAGTRFGRKIFRFSIQRVPMLVHGARELTLIKEWIHCELKIELTSLAESESGFGIPGL
jgi:hypothetical protein